MKILVSTALTVLSLYLLPAQAQPDSTFAAQLESIRQQMRQNPAQAAQQLRAMQPEAMHDEDRQSWVRLARTAAIRTADRPWLSSLSQQHDAYSPLHVHRILLASGHLAHGQVQAARDELAKIGDLSRVNIRDQRRYWGLMARIEQLDGRSAQEQQAIEHIIAELPHWPQPRCQACHDHPQRKGQLPLLDVQQFWFGQRYVALLRQQGKAAAVQHSAQHRLGADPGDTEARILLAYALLAQDQQAEAEQVLQAIPWVATRTRTGPAPRMVFAWP